MPEMPPANIVCPSCARSFEWGDDVIVREKVMGAIEGRFPSRTLLRLQGEYLHAACRGIELQRIIAEEQSRRARIVTEVSLGMHTLSVAEVEQALATMSGKDVMTEEAHQQFTETYRRLARPPLVLTDLDATTGEETNARTYLADEDIPQTQ